MIACCEWSPTWSGGGAERLVRRSGGCAGWRIARLYQWNVVERKAAMCRFAAAVAGYRPEASGGGPRSGRAGCRSREPAAVGVGRYCDGGVLGGYVGGRGGLGVWGHCPRISGGLGAQPPAVFFAPPPSDGVHLLFTGTGKPLAALYSSLAAGSLQPSSTCHLSSTDSIAFSRCLCVLFQVTRHEDEQYPPIVTACFSHSGFRHFSFYRHVFTSRLPLRKRQ